jgi:hypothetical protein
VNNGPTGADALSALNHYMLQENKGKSTMPNQARPAD